MELYELQQRLDACASIIRGLKRKRADINRRYFPYVRNKLDGFTSLWGERAFRNLGRTNTPVFAWYRDLYFEDIKYRSRLRKLRDKLTTYENAYNQILAEIHLLTEQ